MLVFARIALATFIEILAIKKPAASFFFKYKFPFVSVGVLRGKLADTTSKPAAPLVVAARIFAIGEAGFALKARLPPWPIAGIPALVPSRMITNFPFTSNPA